MPPSPQHHTGAAAAAHGSAIAAAIAAAVAAGGLEVWTGMLAFLGPLLVLAAVGRRDAFVRAHAVAALRFNLSVALYLALIVLALRLTTGSPYTVQVVPFLLFLNLLVGLNWLIFTAIGMQRAATAQLWTYPMTLGRARLVSSPTSERPV
jgi:uncharacterized Tic20 family protein